MSGRRFLKYGIFCVIGIGFLVAVYSLIRFEKLFQSLHPRYLFWAGLCGFSVYLLEGAVLYFALRIFAERVPFSRSIRYSLIINAVGYFISIGGITPFATQVHVLEHSSIPASKATLCRIVQVIIFSGLFDVILLGGFISVLLNGIDHVYVAPLGALIGFFLCLSGCLFLSIYLKKVRRFIIRVSAGVLNRIARLFQKRELLHREQVALFIGELETGMRGLLKTPRYLFFILLAAVADWFFWIMTMYFSFLSLGIRIHPGVMIVGFAVGQVFGIISMVPGGLGVLEGSMVLAYSALGVPLGTAFGAILIFRVAFNLVPFFISLPLYFSLEKRMEDNGEEKNRPPV